MRPIEIARLAAARLRTQANRWLGLATQRRVDFVIAGVQKAGTSALEKYLRQHPQLCFPDVKELHFFDDERVFAAARPDYRSYHAHFHARPQHLLLGEATPIYAYWHDAPRRIWQYNPAMKLIVVLRNPIDRAYSHWNMQRQRGKEPLWFGEAIRCEAERCRAALPWQHRLYSYVDRGFYVEQLRRLQRFFPPAQLLVLRQEAVRREPAASLAEVCRFLGIEALPATQPHVVHARGYEEPLPDADWEYLRGVYEAEIAALERLMNWDCQDWLARRAAPAAAAP
jgi:hypothetical protein